jgi:hypothetical protein
LIDFSGQAASFLRYYEGRSGGGFHAHDLSVRWSFQHCPCSRAAACPAPENAGPGPCTARGFLEQGTGDGDVSLGSVAGALRKEGSSSFLKKRTNKLLLLGRD